MKFGILGSGFGIYGYLPALVSEFDCQVVLLENSRSAVESRPELSAYLTNTIWTKDLDQLISLSSGLIIALPPEAQSTTLSTIISYRNISKIVLEKPLAPTPYESKIILQALYDRHLQFRIGYTFLYSEWFTNKLLDYDLRKLSELRIIWKFKAHHFMHSCDTWKRYHSQGGGVINFYAIHLLAVLAVIGYQKILSADIQEYDRDQPAFLCTTFSSPCLPNCQIIVDSNSDTTTFEIAATDDNINTTKLHIGFDPFEPVDSKNDRRIYPLRKMLSSLMQPRRIALPNSSQNFLVLNLWEQVIEFYRYKSNSH